MGVKLVGDFKSLQHTKIGVPAAGNIPTAPAITGYNMWFDAKDTSSYTLSGSDLITWDDQTGNYTLNGSGTKFTTSDWGNGQASFEFNRNQYASFTGNVAPNGNLIISMGSIFAVMRYEPTLRVGASRNFFLFCDDDAYFFHGDGAGPTTGTIADSSGNTNFQNAGVWIDSVNNTVNANTTTGPSTYSVIGLRLNSVANFTGGTGSGASPYVDNIGRDRTFHEFAGYLSELIVYPTLLTNSQMIQVSNDLVVKWGL